MSINPVVVDSLSVWAWQPLNWVYSNPEDGVSGREAKIWVNGQHVYYMPNVPDWWRAYCWSAWRNTSDALKYRFAWANGPQALILGHKFGWWDYYGRRLPVA